MRKKFFFTHAGHLWCQKAIPRGIKKWSLTRAYRGLLYFHCTYWTVFITLALIWYPPLESLHKHWYTNNVTFLFKRLQTLQALLVIQILQRHRLRHHQSFMCVSSEKLSIFRNTKKRIIISFVHFHYIAGVEEILYFLKRNNDFIISIFVTLKSGIRTHNILVKE